MNGQEYLLEGLQAVRSSGRTNMFDQSAVAQLLEIYGYVEERETLANMQPAEYFNLLSEDFAQYLDSNGKNN